MNSLAGTASTLLLLADAGAASIQLSAALAKAGLEFGLCRASDRQGIRSQPLPRIMIVDLDMTRESAFELLAWARSEPRYQQIPVIGLTGLGARQADRAYALGANCCVRKPAEAAQMDGIAQGIVAYASLLADAPTSYRSQL